MPNPRKTEAAKRLQGTARPDRAPLQSPFERLLVVPKPPRTLSAGAKAEWKRLAPIAHELGTLCLGDMRAFELCCEALAMGREAEAAVRREGMTLSTASGSRRAHPAIAVARDARTAAARLLPEFGLTPRGRAFLEPALSTSDRRGTGQGDLDKYLASDPDLP